MHRIDKSDKSRYIFYYKKRVSGSK